MDLYKLIQFRHDMHQNPESAFTEYKTQEKIRQYLISLQIPQESIKVCAKTGLIVDLKGLAQTQNENKLIAFRADIDALIMDEANVDLPYRSTNGRAHMCGHDGHTTCLLGFASIFQANRAKIPSNKVVRLLFQPAEESQGGAVDMINDNCLEGVQEVYGCHQWPSGKIGQIWCRVGTMMSQPVQIIITIKGKGGHASEPHKFNNPVQCGAEFLHNIHQTLSQIKDRQFTFAWTCFSGGSAMNVIPDEAVIKGMVRSLEPGLADELFLKIEQVAQAVTSQFKCQVEIQRLGQRYTLTANTKDEAEHILRLGEEHFGKGNAHSGPCPVYASEDFGNYTLKVPGAFYFLSSGREEEGNPMLHQSNFNFNDDLIERGATFWWKIAQDRLGVQIIQQE